MLPAALGVGTVLALSYFAGPRNTSPMTGPDGKTYDVQNLPDKEEAVKRMASICAKLSKLKESYSSEPALVADPPVARFLARFQPDVFIDSAARVVGRAGRT